MASVRVQYVARQEGAWRGKLRTGRMQSPFKGDFNSTLELLDIELHQLIHKMKYRTGQSPDALIELAVSREQIRLDGGLRGDAQPRDPGVAVIVTTPKETLRFQTDRFLVWRHNLRAIALALEALRKVDRYGVTDSGQQYSGFAALPAGEPGLLNLDQAAALLCMVAGEGDAVGVRVDLEYGKSVWRKAVLRAHPDQGGDAETLRRVNRAAEMLGIR